MYVHIYLSLYVCAYLLIIGNLVTKISLHSHHPPKTIVTVLLLFFPCTVYEVH